ncbi:MAG TPA: hypothetical protein V6D21_02965 [Candidatus Obscuribacterales bacterium]
MYTEEQIEQLCGNKYLKYLKNKNQGGKNNQKGSDYETNFAVYKLALLSRGVIERNELIKFHAQVFAFVDDLIIEFTNSNTWEHYQLKNSKSVTWGDGYKSIADDFAMQHKLNTHHGNKKSKLHLVVNSQTVCDNLNQEIPIHIKSCSIVIYFSPELNLAKLIEKESAFCNAVEYLSAFENPEPDKIECVVTVLLGAWRSHDKSGVSVMDILQRSQKLIPSYIRSFSQEWRLDPDVENILSNIDNFSYNLNKGFLHWNYANELDKGTLPYSIDTEQFQRFQELIKKSEPTSFEQLEVFLI